MINEKVAGITPAEWEIMRVVWTLGRVTSRRVIELMQLKRQWSESTIKTLLSRLMKKGLLQTDQTHRPFVYRAVIDEVTAMDDSVNTLFDHLCAMKRGDTLVNLVNQLTLSRSDLEQLTKVVQRKLPTAPDTVACDCLPAGLSSGHDC